MNTVFMPRSLLQSVLSAYDQYGLCEKFKMSVIKNHSFYKDCIAMFPYMKPQGAAYTRTVVVKDKNNTDRPCHFEAIVANWIPTKNHCPVHGHPQFMYYQIISGVYCMNLYRIVDKQQRTVEKYSTLVLLPGDVYAVCAKEPGYCNAIHSVQCLEKGQTLHIYSNDGTKGELFTEI